MVIAKPARVLSVTLAFNSENFDQFMASGDSNYSEILFKSVTTLSKYASCLEPHVKKQYVEKISAIGNDPILIDACLQLIQGRYFHIWFLKQAIKPKISSKAIKVQKHTNNLCRVGSLTFKATLSPTNMLYARRFDTRSE